MNVIIDSKIMWANINPSQVRLNYKIKLNRTKSGATYMAQNLKRVEFMSSKDRLQHPVGLTAKVLNEHYANIIIIINRSKPHRTALYIINSQRLQALYITQLCTKFKLFIILDRLHPTATGLDRLSAWFLRLRALFFAAPLSPLTSHCNASL